MTVCPGCKAEVASNQRMCSRCGMGIPPARDGYIPALRMHFRTAVILLALVCFGMIIWLPR
ncbi:MAG: hypothetical protein H7A00_01250 [Hahellaceae bacterium]|nr:hypothetical protein [Hahellaceae bacterium]